MFQRHDFKQIDRHLFEVPAGYRKDMRVPARFYADEELLKGIITDNSLQQLINTATLPGIVKYALAMPDIHQGYGFPIGGVVATELPDGIISPGGVGYDINCGVRLLATHLDLEELRPYLDELATILYTNCPSGVGKGGNIKLKAGELDRVISQGARWAVKRGYGTEADLERTEENGCLAGADPAKVSQRAKDRGKGQVGTLGAGNHFIEIDVVQKVFNETAAQRIGLCEGQIAVQIHCGSRGLGHQVCGDYVKQFQKMIPRYGLNL
ncbi:MAG: RtcB family protein, partial [Desulfobacterales bacterium]|nr:RtcB family protein [Desulfobacterales bacterium]